jgi:hypothetical protein
MPPTSDPAFIAAGDIHLTPLIWRPQVNITGDAELAFAALIDVAIENMLPLVLVGDIFDTVEPGPQMIRFFRKQMDRLYDERVHVYAIDGNHDKRSPSWSSAVHEWVQYIGDGHQVTIGGVNCRGLDYALKDDIVESLAKLTQDPEIGKTQVLFLHQAVKQALKWEGKWNCDLDWVPKSIPLVVMGDIHVEWDHDLGAGRRALYTGATHLRDIGQRGPKSCVLVNRDLTWSRLPLPYRLVERFNLSKAEDVDAVETWLKEATATVPELPPVAYCFHVGACKARLGELRRTYNASAFIVMEAVQTPEELTLDQELLADLPVEARPQDQLITPEELLKEIIDPEREPDAFQFTLDLLQSKQSVFDMIKERREKFFAA